MFFCLQSNLFFFFSLMCVVFVSCIRYIIVPFYVRRSCLARHIHTTHYTKITKTSTKYLCRKLTQKLNLSKISSLFFLFARRVQQLEHFFFLFPQNNKKICFSFAAVRFFSKLFSTLVHFLFCCCAYVRQLRLFE